MGTRGRGRTRIAFVFWDIGNTGGAQRVIGLVANALADDHDVHIVNLYGYPEDRGPSIPIDSKVTVAYLGRGTMPRLRQAITQSFGPLRRYLRDHEIDVCILQTTYMGIIGAPVVLANRILHPWRRPAMVFHDHGALAAQKDQRDVTAFRAIAAWLCDATIVLTERSKRDYNRMLRVPRRKIHVITNWIDPAINPRGIVTDTGAKTILWAGRLSSEKGALRVPRIASRVCVQFPEWKIRMFGDGSQRAELENEIRTLGLSDHIELCGTSNDMYAEIPHHSIGILTSSMEGMPMFLLEATAFAMPCVSFDVVTGPNEIIDDGATGYLVDPFDIDDYANKLGLLMESEERRRQMAVNARVVGERFSPQAIVPLWRQFITVVTK